MVSAKWQKVLLKKLKFEKIDFELNTTSREKTKDKIFEDTSYKSFNLSETMFDVELLEKLKHADYILDVNSSC